MVERYRRKTGIFRKLEAFFVGKNVESYRRMSYNKCAFSKRTDEGMKILKKVLFVWIAAAGILLAGCQQEAPQPETLPAETYQVTFLAQGQVLARQTVEAGQCPAPQALGMSGLRLDGWLDETGTPAVPEQTAVRADTAYRAVCYPDISAHVPYLFADADGSFRPGAALTGGELLEALEALAVGDAARYFPGMPAGAQSVTGQQLYSCLSAFFPDAAVAEFQGLESQDTVTRQEFARTLNHLLGRDAEDAVALTGETRILELALETDAPAMLEACLPHSHSEGGETWQEILQGLTYEPGFYNLGGWLYYADETGKFVKDTQVGSLSFGADGRYTSGDEELDALVAGILEELIAGDPGAERLDILRAAYEYSRDSFTYLRKDPIDYGARGWENGYAKTMLTGGLGNCYNYAAVFCVLARGLGYEAEAISGTMTVTNQPHGWVEIPFDGEMYIFDPETEMVYRTQRDIFEYDMFMLTYAEGTFWDYMRYS